MTKIAEGLSSNFSVMAICAQPSYSMRGKRAPINELHKGVSIRRYPSTTFNRVKMGLRLLNVFSICFSSFFLAIRSIRSSDLILVVTNPPLLPFIIWFASKLRGAKFVLRIDDVFPDMLNAIGMLGRGGFVYRTLEKLNLYLYQSAGHIVVLGRDMHSLVLKKIGKQHHNRVHIIPNWGEIDQIYPSPRENHPLLTELQIENKFVVQYAGNMGYPHDIESVVEAAKVLSKNPKIHFLFIGSGVKRGWLERQVKKYGLKNVTLLDPRPRSDQNSFLNACDIAVSALVSGMSGVSVPSKMYNIMAAGKPVVAIGDADSELGFIIQEEKVGLIVPAANVTAFVDAVLEAEDNPERLTAMGKRARQLVEKEYSKEHVVGLYKRLFDEMNKEQKR